MLPAKLRNVILERSGERVLCIGKHESWPCLKGFGKDQEAQIPAILAQAAQDARDFGTRFDRDLMLMQLWDKEEAAFDNSGRFVLPAVSKELGGISELIYFQGLGDYITIWNPDVLLAQTDPAFAGPQARCRAELAAFANKGKSE